MKPEQFIREFGVDKAREVIDGAPELSLFYDLENKKHVLKESTSIAMAFLKNRFLPIEDLKRLVESVDLVKKLSGLQGAKSYVPDSYKSDRLKQAIADHESIYGGGDE